MNSYFSNINDFRIFSREQGIEIDIDLQKDINIQRFGKKKSCWVSFNGDYGCVGNWKTGGII